MITGSRKKGGELDNIVGFDHKIVTWGGGMGFLGKD